MEIIDACDYSRSEEFDGFGFNPVTLESCPPLGNVLTAEPYAVVSADPVVSTDPVVSADPVNSAEIIDPTELVDPLELTHLAPVVTDLVVHEEIIADDTNSLSINTDASGVTQVAVSSGGTSGGGSLGLGILTLLMLVTGASFRKNTRHQGKSFCKVS